MQNVRRFFEQEGYLAPQQCDHNNIPMDIYRNLDLMLRLEFSPKYPSSMDMIDILQFTKVAFKETKRCVGLLMFQHIQHRTPIGDSFDYVRDVKGAINGYCDLLVHYDASVKYKNFVKHVTTPLLETFRGITHEEALNIYDNRINALIQYITECPYQYSDVDAKVAFKVLCNKTKHRVKARKAAEFIHEKRTKVKR